jgi:hypothetical protein
MAALDIYAPTKPKIVSSVISAMDDEEPISNIPSFAAVQRLERADRATQRAAALQQLQLQEAEDKQGMTFASQAEAQKAGYNPEGAAVLPGGGGVRVTKVVARERGDKMTEPQSNALQYSSRMGYNREVLDKLEEAGFDPASVGTGIQNIAPNIMRSPEVQTYRAARDNWVSAVLRKESGAAISKNEYENAFRQYFPQMGDAPEIVKQKRNLRLLAEENMKLIAGGRSAESRESSPGTGTTPAQPPARSPARPPVRMRTPGGQIIIVPAESVSAAQARGATPL